MRVESADAVRRVLPDGNHAPAVEGRVWDERTVMVWPEGTGGQLREAAAARPLAVRQRVRKDSRFHNQTVASSHPAARTFPLGCQLSHCSLAMFVFKAATPALASRQQKLQTSSVARLTVISLPVSNVVKNSQFFQSSTSPPPLEFLLTLLQTLTRPSIPPVETISPS